MTRDCAGEQPKSKVKSQIEKVKLKQDQTALLKLVVFFTSSI
jgi:hypothetical protein